MMKNYELRAYLENLTLTAEGWIGTKEQWDIVTRTINAYEEHGVRA